MKCSDILGECFSLQDYSAMEVRFVGCCRRETNVSALVYVIVKLHVVPVIGDNEQSTKNHLECGVEINNITRDIIIRLLRVITASENFLTL
jgi:hypothetical protein